MAPSELPKKMRLPVGENRAHCVLTLYIPLERYLLYLGGLVLTGATTLHLSQAFEGQRDIPVPDVCLL